MALRELTFCGYGRHEISNNDSRRPFTEPEAVLLVICYDDFRRMCSIIITGLLEHARSEARFIVSSAVFVIASMKYIAAAKLTRLKYPLSLTILLKYVYKTPYLSMVTTIVCVFLWIPDILKELRNVLYESVLKSYFFHNNVF